ncbi:MAG: hypothetical protein AB7P03_08175 [Kofleriaceae bacterium]
MQFDGAGPDMAIDDAAIDRDVPHLPPGQESAGKTPWVVTGLVHVDTKALTITPPTDDIEIAAIAQDPSGPELMVIRASDVTIEGTLDVTGNRPLAIVATTITVNGVIDASATLATPGPGGRAPGAVMASNGVHAGVLHDSGGAGGGFGTKGTKGGTVGNGPGCADPVADGGAPGAIVGTNVLDVLEGGAGGGNGSPGFCATPLGGGGGGAVQLSALERIETTANSVIGAGGGGGAGGLYCLALDGGAGSGGGAGGAIYLDAPTVVLAGIIAANGGGGGSGAYSPLTLNGLPGADALAAMAPASGGMKRGDGGMAGGRGATAMHPAKPGGSSPCDANGGGGGGAVGRVVVRSTAPVMSTAVVTPAPVIVTPSIP